LGAGIPFWGKRGAGVGKVEKNNMDWKVRAEGEGRSGLSLAREKEKRREYGAILGKSTGGGCSPILQRKRWGPFSEKCVFLKREGVSLV